MSVSWTEEEKESLLIEFKSKDTAIEKLEFWIDKMPLSYIEVFPNSHYYPELKEFVFYPKKEELKEFHQYIIDNYARVKENTDRGIELIDISVLEEQIEWELKRPKADKIELLKEEIRKADQAFPTSIKQNKGLFRSDVDIERPTTFTEYHPDIEAFQDYLNYDRKPDYSKSFPMLFYTLISKENGYRLAVYRNYLSKKLDNLKKGKPQTENSTTPATTIALSNKQIALLFSYAGIKKNEKINNVSELARLFVPFLGVSYKNFYDALNYAGMKKSKTKEDLTAILNYIKTHKLKSIQKQVENDLIEASKKM